MDKNRKKDVGLLTWHYYSNVGSALQAYALFNAVKREGYTCEFINYRKYTDKGTCYKLVRNICRIVSDIFPNILPEEYRFRIYAFQKKYFEESKIIKNPEELKELNQNYKCFICGSDQIWAPNVLDTTYLFDFVNADKYKCSYAASIGMNAIPESMKDVYRKNLDRFNQVSVREKQGEILLKSFINKSVNTVLDPTFLLSKESWEKLISKHNKEKLVFCYFLGDAEKYIDAIKAYAKKNDLNIIRFEPNSAKRKGIKKYMGPEEFLGYIKDSELVVTDSFHGVALSINLEKNFYAVKRFDDMDVECQNSRVTNILEICDLNERLLDKFVLSNDDINYVKVRQRLDVEKQRSMEFLRGCLEEGTME